MAIDPRRIATQVALRALQLPGSSQASLEIAYQNGFAALDGADVPVSALVDAVIATEAELADTIAGDKKQPYRSLFYGRSDSLVTGTEIPTESDEGVKFIGIFSGINDSSDHKPLTEGTIQEINRFNRASPSRYTTEIRKFKEFGGRLHHTSTRAYYEGCVWSRAQAYNRFASGVTQLSPIPTVLEGAWVARCLAFLAQEGWFIPEAQYYTGFAEQSLARLKSRDTEMPTLPTNEASANPVVN